MDEGFTRMIISFETVNISECITFHFLVDKCLKQIVYKPFSYGGTQAK